MGHLLYLIFRCDFDVMESLKSLEKFGRSKHTQVRIKKGPGSVRNVSTKAPVRRQQRACSSLFLAPVARSVDGPCPSSRWPALLQGKRHQRMLRPVVPPCPAPESRPPKIQKQKEKSGQEEYVRVSSSWICR